MSDPERFGIDALAVGPHPDDVEIFCGGTLLRLAELGYSTGVLDLTRGELASHGTAEQRAREAEAASAVLGVRFRENLGLPDGFVSSGAFRDSADGSQLRSAVEALRRRRPELLLLPWIEDRHPDHGAAGALLTRAVFFAGLRRFDTAASNEPFAPRHVLYYPMRHRLVPSFIVDTSGVWTRKLEAIACHASQITRSAGDPPTLISSPDAMSAIESRDRYYGSMIGAACGEALKSASTLGIADPVAHFRTNDFPNAHAFEPLR